MENPSPSFHVCTSKGDNHGTPKTPTRKSDQWHRLAAVVRSSQQTFVSGSPNSDVTMEMMSHNKRRYSVPSKQEVPIKTESKRGKTRKSLPLAIVPEPDVDNSTRKIRSLSRTYNTLPASWMKAKDPGKVYRTSRMNYSKVSENSVSLKRKYHDEETKCRKTARHRKDCPASLCDPHSFRYLKGFVVVLILAVMIALLSNKFYWNSAQGRKVKNALTWDDLSLLKKNFQEKIFGQHIATKVILEMIEKVLTVEGGINSVRGIKMVVLSLHGWTGVGKTHITQVLLDSLDPGYFLRFIIPIHFPHRLSDAVYRNTIDHVIRSNISQSAVNVLIFDEMDKASQGVIEGIAEALLHIKVDNSCQNTTLVVLFVSNSLGQKLNNRLFSLLSQGRRREELKASDFDEVFSEPEGRAKVVDDWYRKFTTHGLIDTFVPFLPLNLTHVKQCIKYNLRRNDVKPTAEILDRICKELPLFQPIGSDIQYSQTGCKRVAEKVDLQLETIL